MLPPGGSGHAEKALARVVGAPTLASMAKQLVALLTGAGISTDSGIPDYRGPQGLWTRDPDHEKLVTYSCYMADPKIRQRSWQLRREVLAVNPSPNAAHRAVTALAESGAAVRVITQNTDGLHQAAGLPPRKVLELHGSSRFTVCTGCSARGPIEEVFARLDAGEDDPACLGCGAILKTATVMFGEALDTAVLSEAAAIARACTTMLAVGTSLQVYPAAGLAALAADAGARLVIVNQSPTPYDNVAADVIRDPIGEALPALLKNLTG
jgi:NAD-dependent deacetylase